MSRDAWSGRKCVGTKVTIRDNSDETLEHYYSTNYHTVKDAYREGGPIRKAMAEIGHEVVGIERVYSAD